MSGGIEVKKPIRFFFFFGLFLAFVLLGVRACNERRTLEEVAEVEKILNENRRDLIPSKEPLNADSPKGKKLNLSNSDELQGFKASDSDKASKIKKKTSKASPPKKAKVVKKRKEAPKKPVVSKKPKSVKVAKASNKDQKSKKPSTQKASGSSNSTNSSSNPSSTSSGQPKMKILVKGQGYVLDGISEAKLKGAVKLNSNPSRVEVLLFSEDTQGRSLVVKRAELKSALLRAGLSTRVDVEFKTVERKGYAEILFY